MERCLCWPVRRMVNQREKMRERLVSMLNNGIDVKWEDRRGLRREKLKRKKISVVTSGMHGKLEERERCMTDEFREWAQKVVRCISVEKERMMHYLLLTGAGWRWSVLKKDCLVMFSDRALLRPLKPIHVRSIMTQNRTVELNQVVGVHLLSFLEGIDATNFIEAVNDSRQFWCIAKTLDQHFIKLISTFQGQQRILLPRAIFGSYAEQLEIDEENLITFSKWYSCMREPCERLYIHPSFSVQGFAKLCHVYKSSLFKCYSRLIPFNTTWYDADFGLLNYETYGHNSGSERILNDHELNLFKSKTSGKKNAICKPDSIFTISVDTHFNTKAAQSLSLALRFVCSMNEFKQNLMIRFSSSLWLEAIDFSKMAVVGGCVLNALCHSPFADTREQDVNIISYANNTIDFEEQSWRRSILWIKFFRWL